MNFEERLERLEMELAHQQRTNEQLNEVVAEQSMELLRVQRAIQQMVKQVEKLDTKLKIDEPLDLADEKPPHY